MEAEVRMRVTAAILAFGIATSSAAADFKCWKAPRYELRAIPSEWLFPGIPEKSAGIAALSVADAPYVPTISGFEARYGPPAAYFAATGKMADGQGYLVFELADGGSLAAAVSRPPQDWIGALVLHDRICKFVKLIK